MLIELDIETTGDRIITLPETTWEEYERLLSRESPYLISYLKNSITIVSPGRNHERIAKTIGILVQAYCRKYRIPYFALGSKDIKRIFVAGKQPDESYCFGSEKDIPDLAIEVNYTSGSLEDLEKYRLLEVPEVWMWQSNQLKFFLLQGDSYSDRAFSLHLPKLEVDLLQPFVIRGLSEDNLAIETDFFVALS
ncbi:Uma2 family endonuclease [Myxosarcina sp. GI1(2024)]